MLPLEQALPVVQGLVVLAPHLQTPGFVPVPGQQTSPTVHFEPQVPSSGLHSRHRVASQAAARQVLPHFSAAAQQVTAAGSSVVDAVKPQNCVAGCPLTTCV